MAFGAIHGDRTFEMNLEFPLLGNILEHVSMWTLDSLDLNICKQFKILD